MKYTPTLEVSSNSEVTKLRELPTLGEVLVKVGDNVAAEDIVLRAELPGDIEVVRIAEALGVETETVPSLLKVAKGQVVKKGEILAETHGLFGYFKQTVRSPLDGTIEYFTEINSHLAIRPAATKLEIKAYLSGEVIEVKPGRGVTIRSQAAIIQGVFGLGGERYGEILVLDLPVDKEVTVSDLTPFSGKLRGKIIIGGSYFKIEALKFVEAQQVAAVVTGSIDSATLQALLGYELGVSITGDEKIPYSLVVTEGFGALPISARVIDLAKKLSGLRGSVNGATQVRAGAMRPEVIVVEGAAAKTDSRGASAGGETELQIGSKVRVLCYPFYGQIGEVSEMPHKPESVPCGAIVRVLRITMNTGSSVSVPRSNVELL